MPLDDVGWIPENEVMEQAATDNETPRDLSGQTAVVTGSSSGIGQAIAVELAQAGADCLIHAAKRHDAAEQVAEQVRGYGVAAAVVLADFSELDDQDRFLAETYRWRENIDIWINNAGADVLTGSAAEKSFDEKLLWLLRTDVVASMRLARQVGQQMQSAGRGAILNMGWDQAEVGMAGDSGEIFAAVKGAVMAFSRSLAKSLAPEVRVNCLAPGWIRTSWGDQASDYWQERAENESLLKRWGTPEDVARLARFLVSPAANFITGQIVAVNGGLRQS